MPGATLRVGSHNVNGLLAKLDALLDQWQAMQLDIVAAVDTHVGFSQRTAVQRQLQMRGWTSYWCLGFDTGGQTRAGVALLIRSPLLTSGVLQLRGQPQPAANQGPEQGRLLMLPLQWGRQPIDVVAVYLHAGDPAANVAIIAGPVTAVVYCSSC